MTDSNQTSRNTGFQHVEHTKLYQRDLFAVSDALSDSAHFEGNSARAADDVLMALKQSGLTIVTQIQADKFHATSKEE